MSGITFNQIKAEVAALRRKRAIERPVGIRSAGRWLGAEVQTDGSVAYAISQCDSPLALRLALRNPPAAAGVDTVRVVVTGLPDHDIAADMFARLHRGRLFEIDRWSLVQQLFAADSIDPRLVQQEWLADAVIEHLGGRSLPAAKSGFLDAETLWREFLAATIGLVADVPDLGALFKWSLDGANVRRLRDLPRQVREGVEAWLRSRGGTAADFVFAVADRTERPDAVPLGLAAGVLLHDDVRSKAERSIGKLEGAWHGDRRVTLEDLARAGGEAAAILRAQVVDLFEQRKITTRAEELLGDLDGTAFAHASPILPLGYSQRLGAFATAARAFAADPQASPGPAEKAAARVRRHDQLHAHPADGDRLDMALRLVRWLHAERANASRPGSLAEAAGEYWANGSYVDWARTTIGRVAASRELSDAIACIHEAATREQQGRAETFAGLLAGATAAGVLPDGIIPIERVLDDVVVPIARAVPVLFVILDGMSAAVCRELVSSITRIGSTWAEIAPDGAAMLPPALAAIPCETKYSRASLLAGRLTADCRDEKTAFAAHEGLRGVSGPDEPILYVKSDLGNALPDVIRDEIASPARRVIAAIVNAVDDHLSKADQVDVRWSLETIQVLDGLLHEAASANRVVVLTSDHGHVLECGSTARVKDGGARWRPAGGPLLADEVVLRGRRVLAPGGEIVTSWSESVRYISGTNRGYHGGANPQEMIVPIAVLALAGKPEIPGWRFVPELSPPWWDADGTSPTLARAANAPLEPAEPPPGMLFDIHRETRAGSPQTGAAAGPVAAGGEAAPPAWLTDVFTSDVYAAQKEIVGRSHPGDDVVGRILSALDARGGTLTKPALARAISYPLFRMQGLLSNAQRVLNVDGYQVIAIDTESDTVKLEHETLFVQFGVARDQERR